MKEMLSDEGRVGGALKARFAGCGLASCKKEEKQLRYVRKNGHRV